MKKNIPLVGIEPTSLSCKGRILTIKLQRFSNDISMIFYLFHFERKKKYFFEIT